MIIWAVDPGLIAGAALYESNTDSIEWFEGRAVHILERMSTMCHVRRALIVAERFTFTSQKMTRQYDALEMIGALRWIAYQTISDFELQSRSLKSRVSNQMLRAAGLWDPAHPDDAMDAVRHLVIALHRHRPETAMRLTGRILEGAKE